MVKKVNKRKKMCSASSKVRNYCQLMNVYKQVNFSNASSIRLEAACLDPHNAASTALSLAAVKAFAAFCLAASATS